ncbi:AMP-dependent synthetase/ligase [Spirochaeta isovalerica]|uniref:Long-chain acyl-CoA synthetase n=1 Tax=Spirochaeta isovalerica TaxID=150 RepID=A0A841R8A4_9SPIO|nr:AMP-binding protein [Spirochaeta isovalerica]MBB6479199.1 long-chain acyl-CoA synthetase [Spirochaeta isovalerica]
MKKTVLRMMNEAVEKYGDYPYLANKTDEGWDKIGFAGTRDRAVKIARALVNRGYEKGDAFSIISEGRSEWVISELSVIMLGGVSVPLSLKLLTEEIPFRVNHSESKVIFFSHITLSKVLEARESFDGELLFVYYDDDDKISRLEEVEGLERGKNLVTYRDLLEEGSHADEETIRTLEKLMDDAAEDDVITICYTSGTTGNPKGIMLTHLNYWANCQGGLDVARLPERISTLVILPIDHSFAHTVALYAAYLIGLTLYFVDARGGASSILRNIPANLQETDPYFILTVPAITGNFMKKMKSGVMAKGGFIASLFEKGLKAGIEYHGNGFEPKKRHVKGMWAYRLSNILIYPKLRAVFGKNFHFSIGGGALLDVNQQEFFNAIGAPVYQGYGLSEATPIISTNAAYRHKFGSSGNVLPNIELKIIKGDGQEASVGEKGEIVIRGENVMKGYLKNEEATRETVRNGWLYTGDLGYMDEDDFLQVTGRAKALLISRDGEKYSPEEIEETIISTQDLVAQVMLYCDHSNYTTCLLTVDPMTVRSLKVSSPEELLEKIWEKLNAWQADGSSRFPSLWTPSTFQLITEPFSEQNKMINSTMKMVRYKITETYQDRIDFMYSDLGKVHINEPNINAAREILK